MTIVFVYIYLFVIIRQAVGESIIRWWFGCPTAVEEWLIIERSWKTCEAVGCRASPQPIGPCPVRAEGCFIRDYMRSQNHLRVSPKKRKWTSQSQQTCLISKTFAGFLGDSRMFTRAQVFDPQAGFFYISSYYGTIWNPCESLWVEIARLVSFGDFSLNFDEFEESLADRFGKSFG